MSTSERRVSQLAPLAFNVYQSWVKCKVFAKAARGNRIKCLAAERAEFKEHTEREAMDLRCGVHAKSSTVAAICQAVRPINPESARVLYFPLACRGTEGGRASHRLALCVSAPLWQNYFEAIALGVMRKS